MYVRLISNKCRDAALLERVDIEPRAAVVRRAPAHLVPYFVKDDVGGGDVLIRFGQLLGEQLADALILLSEPPLQVLNSLVRRQRPRP